jgi:hypothetical protein
MADQVHMPWEASSPADQAPDRGEPRQLGLTAVMALITVGNTGRSFWISWVPFFLAGGALPLGIPVCAAQRRHLTPPPPVPPYR